MIRLRHVDKRYPGDTPALADVSLGLEKGEFAFVTGPSGAGKSTLLRLLFGAEHPTSGLVQVLGRNLARERPAQLPYLRRALGVVFQDFKLLPRRTVFDNVALPLEVRGLSDREIRRRVTSALAAVGLEGKASRLPPSLSGGEQQRVAVARAVVGEPAILLADEPTGNLDPERTLEVLDLLHAAHARGTTVLVATHDRTLLERYRKRVITLDGGRLVSDTAPVADPEGAGEAAPSPGRAARQKAKP